MACALPVVVVTGCEMACLNHLMTLGFHIPTAAALLYHGVAGEWLFGAAKVGRMRGGEISRHSEQVTMGNVRDNAAFDACQQCDFLGLMMTSCILCMRWEGMAGPKGELGNAGIEFRSAIDGKN